MASFFCHDFAVTKRFRLERIVRPEGSRTAAARKQPTESRANRTRPEGAARKLKLGRELDRKTIAARLSGRHASQISREPEHQDSGVAKPQKARRTRSGTLRQWHQSEMPFLRPNYIYAPNLGDSVDAGVARCFGQAAFLKRISHLGGGSLAFVAERLCAIPLMWSDIRYHREFEVITSGNFGR